MATKPSAGELSNIADTAWQGEPRIGTIAARDRVVLRALWNAGYAAGLKAAREVCRVLSVHPTQNQSSDYICAYDEAQGDCADAIAKLELDQEN